MIDGPPNGSAILLSTTMPAQGVRGNPPQRQQRWGLALFLALLVTDVIP